MENMYFGASKLIFENASELRKTPTKAEKILWSRLSKNQLGARFKRQHPISYFIADFYCHKAKLVVELDGSVHDNSQQKSYDINRTIEMNELGLKVIRFKNEEIFNDLEKVVLLIKEEVKKVLL